MFFEMPADIADNERTKRIHEKLLFIKNLDLSNKEVLNAIDYLFFNKNSGMDLFNSKNNFIGIKNFLHKIKNNEIRNKIIEQWEKIIGQEENNYEPSIINKHNNEDSINKQIAIKNKINNKNNINKKIIINEEQTIINENFKNNKIMSNNPDANLIAIKKVIEKANSQNNNSLTLEKLQEQNENAKIRCIGLTIETKSDYGKLIQGNEMLRLGCTRVEMGIQSIYDNVLQKTHRGNTAKDNIESIRILKDLGFKINAHYMPGLPYTTKDMDRKGLKELFANEDYRPDMLKLYPCMVLKGTSLYDDYLKGKFKPLETKEAAELIAWFKQFVPPYCRIMRVQRDIPTYVTDAGVDKTNLRQYIEKELKNKKIKCNCIRCREIGHKLHANKNLKINKPEIIVYEYDASKGKEFFISYEDIKTNTLFGFCRLRFPSQILREEITEKSALIRELHVFGSAVGIGKQGSIQHTGIGKMLLKEAEEISMKNNKNKVVVISGVGARNYYRKLGYEREGPYMVKAI